MATDKYEGWILFPNVTVVEKYSKSRAIPQAFPCNSDNQARMKSCMSWARWEEWPDEFRYSRDRSKIITHEGIPYNLDNSGFTLELQDCAENSYQGGKLSFWNCKISKGDKTWLIGIAADLLLELLKSTTFVDGKCMETDLFFATKKGKIGILCKSMDAYQQAFRDEQKRIDMRSGKTTKYVEGCTYQTATQNDVYLGYFYQWFTYEKNRGFGGGGTITKLSKPKKVFWLASYSDKKKSRTDYELRYWDVKENCPSRKQGNETVELNGSLEDILAANRAKLPYTSLDMRGRCQYVTPEWFWNTYPDKWEWPENMKECLETSGWRIIE